MWLLWQLLVVVLALVAGVMVYSVGVLVSAGAYNRAKACWRWFSANAAKLLLLAVLLAAVAAWFVYQIR